MSETTERDPGEAGEQHDAEQIFEEEICDAEVEIIDAYPVPVQARALQATGAGTIQAAAMVATGFVAGAAAMALTRRYAARRLTEAVALERSVGTWPVGSTRTYLVNVRLISKSGE